MADLLDVGRFESGVIDLDEQVFDTERLFEHVVWRHEQRVWLYIVKAIAERHGGRVDVESRPGHTVFSLWLPVPPS